MTDDPVAVMEMNYLEKEFNRDYDIDQYRRKRKRKHFWKKILSWLLAFLIVMGLLALGYYYLVGRSVLSEKDDEFPINLKGETVYDVNEINGNLLITAQANNIFLRTSPVKKSTIQHGYSNPVVEVRGKRVLTYDLGGYNLSVGLISAEPETLKTTTQILFCQMNDQGNVAVVTVGEHAACTLTIYDKNLKQVLKYSVDDYIMALDFTSKGCVFAAQDVENGNYVTTVYGLNYEKEKAEFKTSVSGMMAYSLHVMNNKNLLLVGNSQIITLSSSGKQLETQTYSGEIAKICPQEKQVVLAVRNALNPNNTDLLVVSEDGKIEKQITVESSVEDLYCDKEGIIYLDANEISTYSYELEKTASVENENNYRFVVRANQNVYAMGSSDITVIESLSK